MRLSARAQSIKPSATLTINAKAQELRAQGKEIISLAVGEPDFPTPEHVCRAAKDAMDQGFTKYTPVPGMPALREAVVGYYKQFYDVDTDFEHVIVSNGGKQCLYNLLQCLVDPGDKVLVPGPYWVSYPPMIELSGGKPVIVATEPENDFLVTPDALDGAWSPEARILILNTPSNPTGCHYTQNQLDDIAQWALERDIFVISDEIYDRLVYSPSEPATLAHWFVKEPKHFAIVNGLAKSFAMTGWRVGYGVTHPGLIKAMSKIQGQSTSNICSIAQKAALAALTGSWDCVETMKESFRQRRDLALSTLLSWPGVVCPKPQGAFYLFPKVSDYYTDTIQSSTELCAHILEKAQVALVPGAAFGDDRCIRISYALAPETLSSALDTIKSVLTSLK